MRRVNDNNNIKSKINNIQKNLVYNITITFFFQNTHALDEELYEWLVEAELIPVILLYYIVIQYFRPLKFILDEE